MCRNFLTVFIQVPPSRSAGEQLPETGGRNRLNPRSARRAVNRLRAAVGADNSNKLIPALEQTTFCRGYGECADCFVVDPRLIRPDEDFSAPTLRLVCLGVFGGAAFSATRRITLNRFAIAGRWLCGERRRCDNFPPFPPKAKGRRRRPGTSGFSGIAMLQLTVVFLTAV
jgi:hypothetical protein